MLLDCVLMGCAVEWFLLLLVKSVCVFEFTFLFCNKEQWLCFSFFMFLILNKKTRKPCFCSFLYWFKQEIDWDKGTRTAPPPCIPVALCLICASQSGVLHNASYTGPMLVYCSGGLCHAIQQSPDSTVSWVCRCCPSPRQTSSPASWYTAACLSDSQESMPGGSGSPASLRASQPARMTGEKCQKHKKSKKKHNPLSALRLLQVYESSVKYWMNKNSYLKMKSQTGTGDPELQPGRSNSNSECRGWEAYSDVFSLLNVLHC